MSNEYSETKTISVTKASSGCCLGTILGMILFFSSFVVLFWNESRIDFSNVARNAIEININSQNNNAISKLVYASGQINSEQTLGDDLFLNPAPYIAVNRKVEMYAWNETVRTNTYKKSDGTKVTEKIYKYNKEWQNNPDNSASFQIPSGHENPPEKAIPDGNFQVEKAKIGLYSLDLSDLRLPDINKWQKIPLNQQNFKLSPDIIIANQYLYKGNVNNPQVGDLRIQYAALFNNTNVTGFGELAENYRIIPYFYRNKHKFYQLFVGDKKGAIADLRNEYTIFLWMFRVVGFLMMWIGLASSVGTITNLFSFIPFVGDLIDNFIGNATFILALILTSITIIISILLNNIIAIMATIMVALAVITTLRKLRRN
ncbi:MAG TPA: TMEM43 family protein [Allocoleopsis sp.]